MVLKTQEVTSIAASFRLLELRCRSLERMGEARMRAVDSCCVRVRGWFVIRGFLALLHILHPIPRPGTVGD